MIMKRYKKLVAELQSKVTNLQSQLYGKIPPESIEESFAELIPPPMLTSSRHAAS